MLAVGPVGDGCCMTRRSAPEIIIGLSAGHVAARALHEVAELGVADALDTEPRSTAELAMATGADADALHRLLRLLEAHGLFVSEGDGRWRHSESSRWLRSDHPRSLRAFARMMGLPMNWEAFAGLGRTVRSGEPGYASLDPPGLWAYLAANPDERVVFQEAMIAKAHDDVGAAVAAHDFSAYRCLVDVGGGQGHLLRAVLAASPATRGILFELPEVAATVAADDRLDVVPGNFFTDPLPAADAYVLMNIVHDWDDDEAVAILGAVAAAGRDEAATVLVLETVVPDGPEPHWSKVLDVLMLAVTGGRERTRGEYEALFTKAGLQLTEVVPTATPFSILVGEVR